jgi:exonuclease III
MSEKSQDVSGTHRQESIGGISVYVPIGEADTRSKKLAPRLKTLSGARIGVLDNCKEFADVVLRGVAEVLQREHGIAEVKFWQKSYLGVPSPYAAEMAAQCDAVINGVGH